MRVPALLLCGCLVLAGGCAGAARNVTEADAPRALASAGRVDVRWEDPAGFTEMGRSRNRVLARQGDWVAQLARHLRGAAEARLPEGERMEVVIADIARAGAYEPLGPGHDDVRILRDVYPPMMRLRFRRLDAAGRVVAEGERRLHDPAYLMDGARIGAGDPLRHEKRLIDDWLRRELPAR